MIYECENCGKEFEVAEPICPKCHSGDVIEYNEKKDELQARIDKAIEFIKENTNEINFDNDKLIDVKKILENDEEKFDKLTNELQELALPLQKFINKNYDLETKIIIDKYTIEVVRSELQIVENGILKDMILGDE